MWSDDIVGLACEEDVPPTCHGDKPWLTFDRPLSRDCADPSPNACYAVRDQAIAIDGKLEGWPMISRETFAGAMSVEAVVSARCVTTFCFFGPVIYNGELQYRAVYVAWAPDGRIQVWLYTPRVAVPLSAETYAAGTALLLGIETDGAGNWLYSVDRVVKVRETPGSTGPDTTVFGNPPHLALFMGAAVGTVGRLDLHRLPDP